MYHRLINLMPPHPVYCEPFLGGGAVMRLKRPAAYNIGVDLDGAVIASWRSRAGENAVAAGGNGENAAADADGGIAAYRSSAGKNTGAAGTAKTPRAAARYLVGAADLPRTAVAGGNATARRHRTAETPPGYAVGRRMVVMPLEASGGESASPGSRGPNGESSAARSIFRFLRGDAITFLASYPFQPADLIYCDPPYLAETRSGGRLYRHEMTDEQHTELLATILELPCRVMISGYWSELYACRLKRWNSINFESMTRGGMATEWLWFNFAEPLELHDYRFLGTGNRERTDLKRQKERWIARLERMPILKKRALLSAISTHCGSAAG